MNRTDMPREAFESLPRERDFSLPKSSISPRLLDLHKSAFYLSVGVSTIRDYIEAGILTPVELPGSKLREKGGTRPESEDGPKYFWRVKAEPAKRRLTKILLDVKDLDEFVEKCKGAA